MKYLIGLMLLMPLTAFAEVTFYGQCNYQGPGVTLETGQYNASDLANSGIPEDAIASVKVAKGFSVTLFENDGFKGRFGSLKESDSCLDNDGFSNLVSSLKIETAAPAFGAKNPAAFGNATLQPKKPSGTGGTVTVYSDCNYAGLSAQLAVGDYNLAQLKKFGLGNNELSSVKVPEGMSITVYENDFLRGDSASTVSDVKCIDTGDFANRVTSVSVTGAGSGTSPLTASTTTTTVKSGVVVFDECNYQGSPVALQEGDYTNAQLNRMGIKNNSVSAVQVADGYQVELFLNDFQRGASGVLSTNNPCLGGQYNDAISSMIVRKIGADSTAATDPVATLYLHCNYRGGSAQLPAGRYDVNALKTALVSENTVSSIKMSPGYRATLYSGTRFNGKSVVLTADDDCLDNDEMNEKLSSIVIERISNRATSNAGNFVAQPNQSDSSKSDDMMAGLTCVQKFVDKNACDSRRWSAMEAQCQLARVDELSDGYLKGHVDAGNCNAELWDELVRRTANPHLR